MPTTQNINQIIKLATAGYDATIDCFSTIATERIQEFGDIRVLSKISTAQALQQLLETIHALDKADKDFAVTKIVIAAKKLTTRIFPEVHEKSPIPSPSIVLLSLIDFAKEYRNVILMAPLLEYSCQALKDMKHTIMDLQQAYDAVAIWSKHYPAVVQLKDNNHIASIGGLISAIEREAAGVTGQRLRSGDTTVLTPIGTR